MKKHFIPIAIMAVALLALPCCFSCTGPEGEENEGNKTEEPKTSSPSLEPGEYSFTASALKGTWIPGDKILIRGSYGPAARVITLSEKDIADGGKTAKVILTDEDVKFLVLPDLLYAVCPADAVRGSDSLTDVSFEFTSWEQPISMAYQKDKQFVFADAWSALKFNVPASYKRYAIAGNQRPGLRITSFESSYASDHEYFSKPKTDGYPFRYGSIEGAGTTVYFPGGATLKNGFTLYLGDDDSWSAVYSVKEDVKLTTGIFLDLGDISSSLEAYSGMDPKMPEMGERTKYTIQFNELSGICLSEDGSFLWGVGDNSEIAKISLEGELLASAKLRTLSGGKEYSMDSEGISLNYDTGDLLLGLEPNDVAMIPAGDVDNVFLSDKYTGVLSLFSIKAARNYGNAGLEGITYYKDGMVYAGTQTSSNLFRCNLETGEVLDTLGLRAAFPVISEIAGLSYDPVNDWLWVIDSESRQFFALTGDGSSMLGAYSIKGTDNPESICVDHVHSCIWVGDDYGSTSYLYKYEFTGLDAVAEKE